MIVSGVYFDFGMLYVNSVVSDNFTWCVVYLCEDGIV